MYRIFLFLKRDETRQRSLVYDLIIYALTIVDAQARNSLPGWEAGPWGAAPRRGAPRACVSSSVNKLGLLALRWREAHVLAHLGAVAVAPGVRWRQLAVGRPSCRLGRLLLLLPLGRADGGVLRAYRLSYRLP